MLLIPIFATIFHRASDRWSDRYWHHSYHPYSFTSGVAHSLAHGMAWSLGSHIIGAIFRSFGLAGSIAIGIVLIVVVWTLLRARRA